MDAHDTSTQAIAQSYDEVPYESRPFPQTHPGRSAALARLFGLAPPNVATARILELGCASGGNLIPLASAFPQASFLGVDLSPLQIASGRARIAELGLTNVTLANQSIMELSEAHGAFDYIVCHGVYSWVPAPVREAILRVAAERLTPAGVAYVSYNVHPGWRLRGVLREAMLFHIEGETIPAQRVSKARAFLNHLAEITDGGTAYGQMLRAEARAIAGQADYYILHDYLEYTNEPCYVGDFLERAKSAGLSYLTDANLNVTIAESFGPEKGSLLRELSGNRLDRMEQYIDFLTGRTFRQSLLVRATQEHAIVRMLDPGRLAGLNVTAKVHLSETGDDHFTFCDPAGRTLTTQSPFVRDALVKLGETFPCSTTAQALGEAGSETGADNETQRAQLFDALFKMVLIGMAEISTETSVPQISLVEHPLALPIARADAGCARNWTTNARHESVPLSVVQQAVLPLLDGTHDVDALVNALRAKAIEGKIVFQRGGEALSSEVEIEAAVRDHLAAALASIAESALLIAAK